MKKPIIEPPKIQGINRYAHARLSDFSGEVAKYCWEWINAPQKKPAPMIKGPIGTGKTHLLCAIRTELLGRRYEKGHIRTETSTEIIYEIKNGIGLKISDEILARYKDIPFLLMDDLGAERVTDWTQEQFYLIMDWRWRYCLPTVVTSNHDLEHLSTVLGERIVSRIAGMTKLFTLKGKDKRIDGKK